jgi:putative membrane protein
LAVSAFFIHWGITALSLWVASKVFTGLAFEDTSALWVSALLLGFANAAVRPVLILLTFPLTLLSLGLFMLVINAMMIMLVSVLVRGFKVSSFGTAFFASIFISLLGMFLGSMFSSAPGHTGIIRLPSAGPWI